MSGHDFIVSPRSWNAIEDTALGIRSRFGLAGLPHFPVMEFIERILDHELNFVRFEVGDRVEMGGAMGHTDPRGSFIELREDVYLAACAGEGRARFTAAHELGHLFLHANRPMARLASTANIKPFQLSEPQANQFAAELLMPAKFFSTGDTAEAVAARHGASVEAARNRLQYLSKKGRLPK